MRKRFNLTWRVVTALLLLLALVPALTMSVASAETTPPTLLSIGWVDTDLLGTINANDQLIFYFSESMDTSTLNDVTVINARLNPTGGNGNCYGGTFTALAWGLGNTRLTVTLGTDCYTQLAGMWVDPSADVKDASGNPDATGGGGRQIPVAPDKTDSTRPYLISITWIDNDIDGVIDATDTLSFQFSESMSDVGVAPATIDALLQITGTDTPESLNAGPGSITWSAGNTIMRVVLDGGGGIPETIGGGETMTCGGFTDWHQNFCTVPSTVPSVPLQPNEAAPVLVDVVWTDSGATPFALGQGDVLTFRFSESLDTLALLGINNFNIQNFLVPPAGKDYGTAPFPTVTTNGSRDMIYVTLGSSVNLVTIGDLISPGIAPSQIFDIGVGFAIAKACTGNTVAIPSTSAAMPTVNIMETASPTLRSITWNDINGNGMYDPLDRLNFYFSESINPGTLGGSAACGGVGAPCLGVFANSADRVYVNSRLDSITATGSEDYGTLGCTCQPWIGLSDQMLQVLLGTDEMLSGGEYVNPSPLITDRVNHADNTQGTGPRIPLPADQLNPHLLGIVWNDVNGDGRHDNPDTITFNFDEAILQASFTAGPTAFDVDMKTTGSGTESYGAGAAATAVWTFGNGLYGCQLTITLQAGETIGGGETVNPAAYVTDARGNPDATAGAGPSIPLAPDVTQPTLLNNIVWIDSNLNTMIDANDVFVLSWSESMNPATITPATVNTVLESTAFGFLGDYGILPGLDVQWVGPANTELRIRLGGGTTFVGGEWINPTNAVTDLFGNIDGTAGAGAQIPTVAGTPPSIVATAAVASTAEINGSATAQTISIANGGSQALNWVASNPTQAWLNITPTSGTNTGAITCTFNTSGLAIGMYNDTITITASGATNTPQLVAVTLTITAPATPTPTATTNASPTPTATTNASPTATPTTPPATLTPTPTATPSSSGSGTVGTGEGTVETTDGKISVDFPAGSFASDTTVTITGSTCDYDNTDAYTIGSTCFSVTPSQEFDEPVTICIELSNYDKNLEGDLTLLRWDAVNDEWVEADNVTISSDGNTICGETTHLSDWAVAGKTGAGWQWWYWALIGGGALIVVLAIILLIAIPKKGGKGEEVPADELYGEEEEEF